MLSELLKNMGSKGMQERNSLGSLGGVGGGEGRIWAEAEVEQEYG